MVSVVVPVYNVSKYLADCMRSILAQNISDMEVILIDDGSTDNSGTLCDRYAAEYSCVKVIHQENAGLSAARNTGIEAAKAILSPLLTVTTCLLRALSARHWSWQNIIKLILSHFLMCAVKQMRSGQRSFA